LRRRVTPVTMSAMFDTIIKGATVVDGTGAPAHTADVAISGDTVVEVGRVDGPARRTVEADGLLLTPGFVDIHTHFDGQATWDPSLSPSCYHGVTTAILGNCGIGFAPARPGGHDWLIELMEGVEDIPGAALAEGIKWEWETFPEYLDALEHMPRVMDVGTHVPHAAVRAYVMGERAHDLATEDDLAAMVAILEESLDAGALGFSTGRTAGHWDSRGRPVPGTHAPAEELGVLLGVMTRMDKGVLEVVPAGVGGVEGRDKPGALETELEWILGYGARTTRPLTFLIMQRTFEPDHWLGAFEQVREANRRGASIRPQVADRCFGVLLGMQSRMNPFRHSPSWAPIAELPIRERAAALRNEGVRERLIAEAEAGSEGPLMLDRFITKSWDGVFPLDDSLDYEPAPERSVGAIARSRGVSPWEVGYDLLTEADGTRFLLYPLLNYGRGSYDALYEMMSDPMTVQGLGDGGAHSSLVCDASMTTYMLTHWARDRDRGPKLPLEIAVKRLTKDPSDLYGLGDRGVIAPGRRADLNLIDLEHLALSYPTREEDLPAGAGRLIQRSEGYIETIVAGRSVVVDGELTDERPGRVVRGARTVRRGTEKGAR
jgi:N-acyl-D-amino-acid deacylase